MITKFKIFERGLIPNPADVPYHDVIELGKSDRVIKDYFMEKYPRENIKILGRFGHELSVAALDRLAKFARKNNDKFLSNLIQRHLDIHKEYVNDPEMFRRINKFNI
jgi:hypothetical protein